MSAPTQGYRLNPNGHPNYRIPDPMRYEDNGHVQPFTVEHWLYIHTLTTSGLLATIRPGESWLSDGLNLYLRGVSGAGYAFAISGNNLRVGTPPTGEWVHVAWVYDGTEARIFENASEIAAGNVSNAAVDGSVRYWHTTFNGSSSDAADAEVARLRFWSRPLTQSEVAEAMNAETMRGAPGLLAEYALTSGLRIEQPAYALPAVAAELTENPDPGHATIGGTVTAGDDNAEVQAVAVFAWGSYIVAAIAQPDAAGQWSADVPPGDYGVTYYATGCAPVTHGPYTVEAD